MGILNRRNALLGWLAWKVGKRVAKRRAKSIVGREEGSTGSVGRPALLGGLAALAAAVWGWRRLRKGDDTPDMPG